MIYHTKLKLTMWSRRRRRSRPGRAQSSGDLNIWVVMRDLCTAHPTPLTEEYSGPGLWDQIEMTAHTTGRKR